MTTPRAQKTLSWKKTRSWSPLGHSGTLPHSRHQKSALTSLSSSPGYIWMSSDPAKQTQMADVDVATALTSSVEPILGSRNMARSFVGFSLTQMSFEELCIPSRQLRMPPLPLPPLLQPSLRPPHSSLPPLVSSFNWAPPTCHICQQVCPPPPALDVLEASRRAACPLPYLPSQR